LRHKKENSWFEHKYNLNYLNSEIGAVREIFIFYVIAVQNGKIFTQEKRGNIQPHSTELQLLPPDVQNHTNHLRRNCVYLESDLIRVVSTAPPRIEKLTS
jgi:hypothetical protein